MWCAQAAPLLARPTSSASVQLHHSHGQTCRAAAFEVLYREVGSDEWRGHEQVGMNLPFELGGLYCGGGCVFRLRGLNATSYARRERLFNLSAERHHVLPPLQPDGTPLKSAESDIVVTPQTPIEAPHPPGVRLELFIQPPLAPPLERGLHRFVDGLVAALTSPHFYVAMDRIVPVEVRPESFENVQTTRGAGGPNGSRSWCEDGALRTFAPTHVRAPALTFLTAAGGARSW